MFRLPKKFLLRSKSAAGPSLESILDAVREQYILAYRRALSEYRRRYTQCAPEVMFEISKPDVPIPFRYYRTDLVSADVSPPNITKVIVEQVADFPGKSFILPSGLSVVVHPMAWNEIHFVCTHFDPTSVHFVGWCSKWIDVADQVKRDSDGLGSVIHSVTLPIFRNGDCEFCVDFGSAPVTALNDLLTVLKRAGCCSAKIGSVSR